MFLTTIFLHGVLSYRKMGESFGVMAGRPIKLDFEWGAKPYRGLTEKQLK